MQTHYRVKPRLRRPRLHLGFIRKCVITVATFVPTQAAFLRFSPTQTAFAVRKILIDKVRAKGVRIRNAWVPSSNPGCGTIYPIKTVSFMVSASDREQSFRAMMNSAWSG